MNASRQFAATGTCAPAIMQRELALELPALEAVVTTGSGTRIGSVRTPESFGGAPVMVEGPGVQVLLAVRGRSHTGVTVNNQAGLRMWNEVPSQQAQFGAWD